MLNGAELRHIADGVNQRLADDKSSRYLEQIMVDCEKAAKMGRYRAALDATKYPEVYNLSERLHSLVIDALKTKMHEHGIELISESNGIFDADIFYADFSK